MLKKRGAGCIVCFLSLLCLLSCGLEAFYYIDYIQQGDMDDVIRATLWLPREDAEGYNYFDHFEIYYRIYISGENRSGIVETADERTLINTTLNSDFSSLYSYTDITSTSVNTSNLATTFFNRNYSKLLLEEADIAGVLGRGSLGGNLEIAFPPNTGVRPTLILNGTSYTLYRAIERPTKYFTPRPDRFFLNDSELYDTGNVTDQINADVATNSKTSPELRYTYVAMYITAVGTTMDMPPQTIYSQPTFIGVFKLAESS